MSFKRLLVVLTIALSALAVYSGDGDHRGNRDTFEVTIHDCGSEESQISSLEDELQKAKKIVTLLKSQLESVPNSDHYYETSLIINERLMRETSMIAAYEADLLNCWEGREPQHTNRPPFRTTGKASGHDAENIWADDTTWNNTNDIQLNGETMFCTGQLMWWFQNRGMDGLMSVRSNSDRRPVKIGACRNTINKCLTVAIGAHWYMRYPNLPGVENYATYYQPDTEALVWQKMDETQAAEYHFGNYNNGSYSSIRPAADRTGSK